MGSYSISVEVCFESFSGYIKDYSWYWPNILLLGYSESFFSKSIGRYVGICSNTCSNYPNSTKLINFFVSDSGGSIISNCASKSLGLDKSIPCYYLSREGELGLFCRISITFYSLENEASYFSPAYSIMLGWITAREREGL